MKLITFAVPCYNSAAYMEHCVETLLSGGEEVEILLIDDGSTDATGEIADQYAADYPNIIRTIHQPNGGHGEGVNQGIRNAAGLYYKVVDSDDWLDTEALGRLMEVIRANGTENPVDLYICNYVYENVKENTHQSMSYRNVFPVNRRFTWEEMGRFRISQYLLMHTAIYRTEILRQSGVELPKHTFYVDNIFVYTPLPFVKSLYYLDVDLYRYFIGREDQSVNEHVMVQRADQQLKITQIMKDEYTYSELQSYGSKLAGYMVDYLTMMMAISTVFLNLGKNPENVGKRDTLWKDLKQSDPGMYRAVRRHFLGFCSGLPGAFGRKISVIGYRIARKLYKFN